MHFHVIKHFLIHGPVDSSSPILSYAIQYSSCPLFVSIIHQFRFFPLFFPLISPLLISNSLLLLASSNYCTASVASLIISRSFNFTPEMSELVHQLISLLVCFCNLHQLFTFFFCLFVDECFSAAAILLVGFFN